MKNPKLFYSSLANLKMYYDNGYYTDFKLDTKKSKIETSLLIQNLLKVHGKVNGNVSKKH